MHLNRLDNCKTFGKSADFIIFTGILHYSLIFMPHKNIEIKSLFQGGIKH
jgi:hypothetical protein